MTDFNFEQLLNVPKQISVMLSGITIDVKLLQPANAHCSIKFTLSGIVIDFNFSQQAKP